MRAHEFVTGARERVEARRQAIQAAMQREKLAQSHQLTTRTQVSTVSSHTQQK